MIGPLKEKRMVPRKKEPRAEFAHICVPVKINNSDVACFNYYYSRIYRLTLFHGDNTK